MDILYFAIDNNSSTSGISKKIKDQALAIGTISQNFFLVLAHPSSGVFKYRYNKDTHTLDLVETIPPLKRNTSGFGKLYATNQYYKKNLVNFFEKVCKEEKITSVYCRRISMIPSLIRMFRKTKKKYKFSLVYEIPTYPYFMEIIKNVNLLYGIFEILFSKRLYSIVDHFFLIIDTASEKKIPFKNWTRISNGINVDRIPVRSDVRTFHDGLHLLGLANVAFWHGYDRVIKGLADYYSDAKNKFPIFFHIVGEGPVLSSLKQMALDLGVEKYVIFHGPVYGEELDKFINSCHIAVASLGLHRIGIHQGSVLKAREYCARGMPFFMSMKDPDFDLGLEFIHYVPEDDSAINIEDIVHFSRSMIENSDAVIKEMRAYAELHLDWKKTMKKVYSVFADFEEKKKMSLSDN